MKVPSSISQPVQAIRLKFGIVVEEKNQRGIPSLYALVDRRAEAGILRQSQKTDLWKIFTYINGRAVTGAVIHQNNPPGCIALVVDGFQADIQKASAIEVGNDNIDQWPALLYLSVIWR